MQNKFTSRSKHLDFIILDLICIEVSYWLAYYIRLGRLVNSTPGEYTMMNIMVILIHLSIMFISEGYSGILMRNAIQELKKVVIHNAEMFAVILFISLRNNLRCIPEYCLRCLWSLTQLPCILYVL